MDLTAQVLHDAEFREARRGGYNTQDVDEFLERLAMAVDRQDALLREARQRLAGAEQRASEAEGRLADVDESGEGSEAGETLKRTLVLAQRTADAAVREAEERAARVVAAAEDEASTMLSDAQERSANARAVAEDEARQAHAAARSRVLAELGELEGLREQLRGEVELLERHIEGQRERLRVAIHELQALVDDPAGLRETPVPQLEPVDIPSTEPDDEPPPVRPEPLDQPAPEPVARPERSGGRLVAEPIDDVEAPEEDDGWLQQDDAYGPVQAPEPPVRTGPRPTPRDAPQPAEEDEYLAELRRAMADDEPLGPRDEDEDDGPDQRPSARSRFGRRR